MSEIDNLGGVTGQLLRMGLDASIMKHQVIANNIANVNSQGYTPVSINFEAQLAMHKSQLMDRQNDAANSVLLNDITPHIERASESKTEGVSRNVLLDMEMANMARNVVHYQALLEGRAKKGALLKMAITGGQG